jgi:hypothetical protein
MGPYYLCFHPSAWGMPHEPASLAAEGGYGVDAHGAGEGESLRLRKSHRKDARSAKDRKGHRAYPDLKILSLCHRRKSSLGRSTKLGGNTAREFP